MSKFNEDDLVKKILANKGGFAATKLTEEMKERRKKIAATARVFNGQLEENIAWAMKALAETVHKVAEGDIILPVPVQFDPDVMESLGSRRLLFLKEAKNVKEITPEAAKEYARYVNTTYAQLEKMLAIAKMLTPLRGDLSSLSKEQLGWVISFRELAENTLQRLGFSGMHEYCEDNPGQTEKYEIIRDSVYENMDLQDAHFYALGLSTEKSREGGRGGGR